MKITLILAVAAASAIGSSPAFADTAPSQHAATAAPHGATLLSDAQMDNVVAGQEVIVEHELYLPIYNSRFYSKTINLPSAGAQTLTEGAGPNNSGVQQNNFAGFGAGGFNSTTVGVPSNGHGAELIDYYTTN